MPRLATKEARDFAAANRARVLAILQTNGPLDTSQICKLLNLPRSSVRDYARALARGCLIHAFSEKGRNGGSLTIVYHFGPPDAHSIAFSGDKVYQKTVDSWTAEPVKPWDLMAMFFGRMA